MKASAIFGPITDYLQERGLKDNNTQIEKMTGIERHRVANIKKNPRLMTVGELETLGNTYGFKVNIVSRSTI